MRIFDGLWLCVLTAALVGLAPLACGDDEGPFEPVADGGGGGGGDVPTRCESSEDCSGGLVCVADAAGARTCQGCQRHGDCARAQLCNAGTRACEFRDGWSDECGGHDDCPLGMFCVQGGCSPGELVVACGALGQCPEGLRCNRDTVVCEEDLGCFDADDCGSGEVCNPGTQRCEVRCTPETETDVCAARERCSAEGRCVECETDDECGPGLTCNAIAGRCAGSETCFTDRDCEAGDVCNRATSTCTDPPPPCLTNDDCLSDERCDLVRGRCVLAACQADQDEPNDAAEDAVSILPGDREGLTVCGTEEDWFSVALRRGDRVNVNVEADVLSANGLVVQLRDAVGRILDEDPFLIDAVVADDATYFLRVRTRDEQTRYALHVIVARGTPCDDDASEDNDEFATAASLAPGRAAAFTACPADPDWFVIDVPGGKRISARLSHDPLAGDLDLFLFDSDGVSLLSASRTTSAEETVQAPGVAGSRAFLQVLSGDDRIQNAYDLQVTVE